MKAALLIQSIALPAILANLLTVDLVAPLQDYDGITVTGKKQSADDQPVTMSRIPGDKAVCLGDDNMWTWYCADRKTVQYIGRIGFAVETKDPRPMTLDRVIEWDLGYVSSVNYTTHCNLTVTGEGDLGNLIWDVTNGQKGLRDPKLEPGFKSDAIKIECDRFWVNTAIAEKSDYLSALAEAEAKGRGSYGEAYGGE